VHGDAIYLTGGLEGDPNNANDYEVFAHVLRATIDGQGVLGPWVEVGAMPFTLNTHASFVHGDHLYVAGGIADDHHNTDAVYRAPIAADGTVGPWEAQAALPTPRAHAHQTPVWGDFVFATGGALNHMSTARTFVGRFE
jgi:N-acetylneuraminic acid mutarotase